VDQAKPDRNWTSLRAGTGAPVPPRASRRLFVAGAAGALLSPLHLGTVSAAKRSDDAHSIARIVAKMSIAEKAGQLFVVEAADKALTPAFESLLRDLKPGGVIFFAPNVGTAEQLRAFVKAIHRTNEAMPPLVAIDQEGGPVARIPGDPAPGAVELGREPDKTVRKKARERAEFLADFGFDVNFAPVADVAYKPTSFMAARSFGCEPHAVAKKVRDFVGGTRAGGIAGAAKHFPGHGRTPVDSHVALPNVLLSPRGWRKSDALPFRAAIEGGVEMVMVGHLRYPKWDDAPASLSRVAVSTLRKELGFRGVVVTDDLGMGALRGIDPFEVVDRAIAAGVDLLLYASFPVPIDDLITHVRRRVHHGELSEKRLDASLRRILAMKARRFELSIPKRSHSSHHSSSGRHEVKER
jgi:beta-N-acetylhexosaminidase